ncbi:inositol-phosphate phosphatase-like [Leptopilina heterotoma]|uniref:inositol-phosphate phosphatase-like n=1 Tax=Leptopilina heterotoma TaxID=63436 RepID=UPI001CA9CD63|nr:inositol-phosphate phosphatase-like [Leptopilina heterotoma]
MSEAKDIEEYFEIAKELTLKAGEVIKTAFNTEKSFQLKTRINDLITEYDKRVEDILIGELSKKFPNHKFIGEESVDEIPELTNDPTWIIDPIDGTTNFVHSYPESCISLALTISKELVIGIIYNPVNGDLYTAQKNKGSFLNGNKIKTSSTTELTTSLVSTDPGLFHEGLKNRDLYVERLKAFATSTHGIRSNGSAALTLAYVARGIVDIYQMQLLKPWDVAAGTLILQEAGGVITDQKGQPFNIMQSQLGLLATSNHQLHEKTIKLIIDTDLKTQRQRLKRT